MGQSEAERREWECPEGSLWDDVRLEGGLAARLDRGVRWTGRRGGVRNKASRRELLGDAAGRHRRGVYGGSHAACAMNVRYRPSTAATPIIPAPSAA